MTRIYYFTGTGNSLQTALSLKEMIDECEIIAIKDVINQKDYNIEAEQVGFVMPTYFYGPPIIVTRFIEKTDLSKAKYIFVVATAMFPDGIVLSRIKAQLESKRKQLNYGVYIKMPPNYVSAIEPWDDIKRDRVLNTAGMKVKKIATDIMQGKYMVQKERKVYNIIVNANSAYAKWQEQVNETDRNFIIQDTCNGCGTCENVCPVNNIVMADDRPSFGHRCEQCYGCINLCPKRAIGYAKMMTGRYKHPQISLKQIIGSKK